MTSKHTYMLLLIGFSGGFASAAVGIAGGTLIIPALIYILGHHVRKAVGSSLAAMAPATFVGAVSHYFIQQSHIEFLTILLVLAGSLIGTRYGARVANKTEKGILLQIFAVLLLLLGLELAHIITFSAHSLVTLRVHPLLFVLGLLVGFLSGLSGVGGGAILMPTLNLFFGFPTHQAIATSLAILSPTAFSGALHHKKMENLIPGKDLKLLISASLTGAVLGAVTSNALPAAILQSIAGIFLILLAIKIIWEQSGFFALPRTVVQ